VSDGAGGSVVRWYELVPATMMLVQSGKIGDRGRFAFNGAIAPTQNGGAVIDYDTGGADREVELKAQSRLGSDTPGTMSGPLSLATSSAVDSDFSCPSQPFGATNGTGVCRWGDYAGASVDPSHPDVVWGSNQVNGQTGASIPRFGHQAQWVTENFALTPTATPAPTASFTVAPNPVLPGLPTSLDGSGSSDPGDVIDYSWSFGDGSSVDTGTSPTVSHAYGHAGSFSVQLTVTHSGGRTASTTETVIVDQPTAAFTASPNPAIPGAAVAFDATSSSDAAGTIAAYSWSFGDGASASGATTSHTYAAPGSYPVTLTVTNNHGQTAATSTVVTVNAPPTAAFAIAPNPALAGAAVSFDATSSTHPSGLTAGYTWAFGDGGTASGPVVSHTYTAPGTYGVTLVVIDSDGQSATTIGHVTVTSPPPPPPKLSGHLAIRGHPGVKAIQKHGLGLTLSISEAGRATFTVTARILPRRAHKARTVTLVRGRTMTVASGRHGITLKLSRLASRALGAGRAQSVSVKVTVVDAFGQKLTLSASRRF
jgi:PKD repeat protein